LSFSVGCSAIARLRQILADEPHAAINKLFNMAPPAPVLRPGRAMPRFSGFWRRTGTDEFGMWSDLRVEAFLVAKASACESAPRRRETR
jgi:hypothetical protein